MNISFPCCFFHCSCLLNLIIYIDWSFTHFSPPPSLPSISCSVIRFDIATSDFRYPTPCTDRDPNGILLSLNETANLAYFAPLANTQWDNFNAANITLNVSNTSVPIWSPQLTEVLSTCVSNSTIDKREMLDIVWKQDRYVTGQDYWYLRIRDVLIRNIPLYITATNDSARYE